MPDFLRLSIPSIVPASMDDAWVKILAYVEDVNRHFHEGDGVVNTVVAGDSSVTVTTSEDEVTIIVTDDGITNAKLRESVGFSVIGKATTGTGNPADITVAADRLLGRSGSGNLGDVQTVTNHYTNDSVTYEKIQNTAAGFVVIGKSTTGGGDVAEIACAADRLLGRSGSGNLGDVQVVTNHVTDANITYAKIQNISATQRVLGRNTSGAGVTEEVTASQVLDWRGTTRGSLFYRGASTWDLLSPGTSGHVLTSNGAGADPTWEAAAGGGISGAGAANQVAYFVDTDEIDSEATFGWATSTKTLLVENATVDAAADATLHLKTANNGGDPLIAFTEGGHGGSPWVIGVDHTSVSHPVTVAYGSIDLQTATPVLKINSGGTEFPNGDVTFTSSGSQSFTKEGSGGNLNFRTNATAKEITFRPNLVEAVQYVAHDGTTCANKTLAPHNLVVGGAARAASATDGFLYIPSIDNLGVAPTGDVRDYSDTRAMCYGTIDLGEGDLPALWVNTDSATGWWYVALVQG